ncbi:MAG TPA: cyclic nucleotide-binding domain-containing protein [Acidimicrobiia bacterium]|nr:cyclic nucleotide-binding domain-containing protein [Acidimicrobiia bacterium]
MAFEVAEARTVEEKEAVYRFRYSVYVEEMGRYQGSADHEGRRLVEAEDETSWIFFAKEGDDVVGTARLSWGERGFSERQVDEYSLAPFLDQIPHRHLAIGERVMVTPRLRGTGLVDDLLACRHETAIAHDVRVQFSACEPHLLSLYLGQGRRTYATRNINSPEAGYLIPLVVFPLGTDVLVGLDDRAPDAAPDCVAEILTGRGGAVLSPLMSGEGDYTAQLRSTLHEIEGLEISAFHSFTDDEVERCLARSNVIECAVGDHVIKKGGVARNLFVVLAGTLEVRDGDRVVAALAEGDVFGEMAFLLERPRALDAFAASAAVRVLSLSEHTLRAMIDDEPVIAAKLVVNISKMLCVRLIKTTGAA